MTTNHTKVEKKTIIGYMIKVSKNKNMVLFGLKFNYKVSYKFL